MAQAVRIKVEVDAAALLAKFGALAGDVLRKALRVGHAAALEDLASKVTLKARSKGLKQRTGQLLASIAFWQTAAGPDALVGYVGVPSDAPASRYAYLLTGQTKTIVPVNAKALTIPVGANLTGAGVARFRTVADLIAAFGDAVVFAGRNIGVRSGTGAKAKLDVYFKLAAQTTVKGRDVLDPAARESAPELAAIVQAEVDQAVRRA